MDDECLVRRRIAVMGFPRVGRTSIITRYIYGEYCSSYASTIEDIHEKKVIHRGREILIQVADTAGQQEHSVLPQGCAISMDGFVLVYAIDDRNSFNVLSRIYDRIMQVSYDCVPLIIVGNKLDLQQTSRRVGTSEGKKLADSWNAAFIEASAKDDTGIQSIFELILREVDRGNCVKKESSCSLL